MTEHDIARLLRKTDNMGGAWKYPPTQRKHYGGTIVTMAASGVVLITVLIAALAYAEPNVIVHYECGTERC